MKFVFEGFELDTEKVYVDYAGDVVKLSLKDGELWYTSFVHGAFEDCSTNYGKSGNGFCHSFAEVEIKDKVKKSDRYEKGKVYLFSDDEMDWYPDIFRFIEEDGRYMGRLNGLWLYIKVMDESELGGVL